MANPDTQYVWGPVRDKVLAMRLQGKKTRDIAALLGISTQRVNQHTKALREAGALPEERVA